MGWILGKHPRSHHHLLPNLFCSIGTLTCTAETLPSIQSTLCLHSGQDFRYSRATCKTPSNCISCVRVCYISQSFHSPYHYQITIYGEHILDCRRYMIHTLSKQHLFNTHYDPASDLIIHRDMHINSGQ